MSTVTGVWRENMSGRSSRKCPLSGWPMVETRLPLWKPQLALNTIVSPFFPKTYFCFQRLHSSPLWLMCYIVYSRSTNTLSGTGNLLSKIFFIWVIKRLKRNKCNLIWDAKLQEWNEYAVNCECDECFMGLRDVVKVFCCFSLLKVHLQVRSFTVFIDVERLEAGKFDNNLLQSIRQAKHFLLVLTPNALERCREDGECKDWVHRVSWII